MTASKPRSKPPKKKAYWTMIVPYADSLEENTAKAAEGGWNYWVATAQNDMNAYYIEGYIYASRGRLIPTRIPLDDMFYGMNVAMTFSPDHDDSMPSDLVSCSVNDEQPKLVKMCAHIWEYIVAVTTMAPKTDIISTLPKALAEKRMGPHKIRAIRATTRGGDLCSYKVLEILIEGPGPHKEGTLHCSGFDYRDPINGVRV